MTSTIEKIQKLLLKGWTPKEIEAMGYAHSTVMEAKKRLEKKKQKEYLLEIAQQLMHKRKGTLEIIISDLIMQAIRANDQLLKIMKICEVVDILEDDIRQSIFTEKELKEFKKIRVVAIALYNAYSPKLIDDNLYDKKVKLILPIPYEKVEEYLSFLKNDPEANRFVSIHFKEFNNEEKHLEHIRRKYGEYAALKSIFFFNITGASYTALKTYFISYALPVMLKALRKISDLIQPSTLSNVLAIHGGVKSGDTMDKGK